MDRHEEGFSMPRQLRAHAAAFARRMTPFLRRLADLAAAFILAALMQACARTPTSPFVGADPSDPSVRTPAAGYRSTIAPYASRRPVEPAPWREQNERLAPPAKPAE
jgi:hypothetical protein